MREYRNHIRKWVAAVLALMLLLSAVPAFAATFSAIVTSKSMAVYSDVAMTDKLGELKTNTVVRITGYSTSIAKVSYKGRSGYAKTSDMKRVEDVAAKAVTNAQAPVYQSADTDSISIQVPAGTRLYVLEKTGDWARVEKDGAVGYMKIDCLEEADDNWQTGVQIPTASATTAPGPENGITVRTYSAVTVEDTIVYRSANTNSRRYTTLKAGVQLTVLATSSNGWAYIELNKKHGYCKTASLKEGIAGDETPSPSTSPEAAAGKKGVVNVPTLTVYQSADTDSNKLGTLEQGQEVNVLKWNSQWAYIELNGRYGFCAVAGLSKAGAQATTAPTYAPSTANAQRGTVTADSLTVYQTAGTEGKVLGKLKKGQAVNVIQTNDGWSLIELNDNYGFCDASGISIDKTQSKLPAGFKKADFTATVVMTDIRAYSATDTDAESVTLKQGTEVKVVGYNKTWACIQQGENYAFVAVKALSKAKYEAISSDGKDLQTLLKALLSKGYYDAVPGTSYNAAAIAAIKRFQSACGMEQTGVADENMLRIVYSGYAPVSSLLYSTLSSGDKGDNVSRMQSRLYALGYLTKTSSLSGDYNNTTVSAVKLFQNANGLSATGKADTDTLKAMYNPEAKKLPSGTKAADATKNSGSGSSSTYLNEVPAGLESTTSSYSDSMSSVEKLEYVIFLAQNKLGCPYVYGATGPDKFDCSGLTCWGFNAVGVSLKRTAYNQGYDDSYEKIEGWKNLKRGDVVFFNTISDSDLSDHAGIYLGDGYFIHASSGAHKVVVSNLSTGFYGRVFSWGRRILK